jgi:hypothetical protein
MIAHVRHWVLLSGRNATPLPVSLWTGLARLLATGFFYWTEEEEAQPASQTMEALLAPLVTELGYRRPVGPVTGAVTMTGDLWPGWLRIDTTTRHRAGAASLVLEAGLLAVPPELSRKEPGEPDELQRAATRLLSRADGREGLAANALERGRSLAASLDALCRGHLAVERSGSEVELAYPGSTVIDAGVLEPVSGAWFSALLADASRQPHLWTHLHTLNADGGGDLTASHHDNGGGQL